MVIPLGGGDLGPPPMPGPPPAELLPRFRKIKISLMMLILSIAAKLGAGIPLFPKNVFGQIYNVFSAVLLVIIGIFLLKDDRTFSGTYRCLVKTFCGSCEDTCAASAGVQCLCSWFFCCTIAAVFGLLPVNGSDITVVIAGFTLLGDPSKDSKTQWGLEVRSTAWTVALSVFTAATLVGLLAEIYGAYQGMKGFSELGELQAGGLMGGPMGGGDWSDEGRSTSDPYAGGGGNRLGGGRGGGGGGGPGAAGQNQPTTGAAPPRQGGFQPFAGQGQRLGS
mmetsp:Transcript_72758/g.151921  ORF Transcript_72758/g.151921 Transcript_72758/m.151921 type:complete len:278 (+) Transcript_72758:62-895(+)|eukprot:CAMPEP_0206451016 /NCGR_PEP_ID=MMETSP0324_2-20121206/19081_1 /ASSEMBLY_ACC=CAM_ASM_000836 /TAXON_ID=2866 /ORGANISM="Crypthecodinium cohnii, Strain Seligo" /LENGTH=277 /DNA_ID=CAMNT_0053920799 /DNA_START=43 /DNA_END=876 /DNA_ORIENTATION=-